MDKFQERDELVNVNISTKRRDAEEVKRILGDVGSMQTCCVELQCFLCDIMETELTLLRPLYTLS